MLDRIEIEPKTGAANASVIWLHGLGASGDDFSPIVPQLKLNESIRARFIFPRAPLRAMTFNGGVEMPAWYDFTINGMKREVDPKDLKQSRQQILALIEQEIERGVPSNRIVLAGFSQGGAIAYDVAFSVQQSIAGLMAMSTYVADEQSLDFSIQPANLPIHIYHGIHDQVVPLALGKDALAILERHGLKPEFSEYAMEHSVCLSQIRDITAFLNRVLGE